MKATAKQCKVYVQRNAWTIDIDQHTLYWFGNIASMLPISPTIFQQVNGELLNIYSTNVAVTMQNYKATL